MRVGLTGGVGSGKSTVARLLAEHGAVVIDADAVAREVMAKGTPSLAQVVDAFGEHVLTADGELDRPAVAALVFSDEQRLQQLNGIIHPLVRARVAEVVAATDPDDVVVHDVPLLVETNPSGDGYDLVLVVQASLATRLARLAERGMGEQDARERMARQADDEQRRAVADVVIDNDGSLADLRSEVERAWVRIVAAQGG
ncbi:dephospho-CoA kinase [uncultured Jatrophihabitans sp.]|uniref:dephospho-CoA kinase n=1 Tax=uncultured Jatrophihabitans sp. TaxID=1610747 RepID=UPI0035C96411